MLIDLHVKNFALIDNCEIEFSEGLNILTGETGAGKSIIIDSVNAALGARASKDVIRNDSDPATIELLFSVEDESVRELLKEMDISCDDQIIISRKIGKSASVSKINGETVTAAQVKRVAEHLIDIHGQHEDQSLLSPAKHLEILDKYGEEEIAPVRGKVADAYKVFVDCRKALEESAMDPETRKREISFLEYEIKEIEDAKLTPGEDESLEADYRLYSNREKITETLGEVYELTGSGRGGNCAVDSIGEAFRRMGQVAQYDERLAALLENLGTIESLTSDFNRELSAYISDNEFDEETFNEITARLDLVNNLKSKFGSTIPDILKSLEDRKNRLEELTHIEDHINELEEKKAAAEKVLDQECTKLSKIRRSKALVLSNAIKEALADLNFLQVEFEISFKEAPVSAKGRDEVHFMISTNPGEPVKELSGVASGGELSRIMLAIKTILAGSDEIPTLIFDEIDAGISGRTAQKVSEKLSLVGRNHQVICITHLPQIASMADAHYLIEKHVEGAATVSQISLLDEEGSIKELARMLGGAEITETTLANAKEMKEMAHLVLSSQ
ncbi:MAG: DNA repair protein RecN [Lachnospiraceae bacterium]|nr:DNA repair protein RecN [Lachnospiraceae bacterium]